MKHPIFGIIKDEVTRLSRRVRTGFYVATTSAVRSYRRVQVVPEWLDEGAVENFRRISSPLVDVIPALGTRVAVISQDGVPELGAMLGQIWDDLAELPTAWVRANLQDSPGRIEVGAEKSIHLVVKSRDGEVDQKFELEDIGDGVVRIGSETVDLLSEISSELAELQDALTAIATFGTAIETNAAGPLTAATVAAGATLATEATSAATELAAIQTKIDSIKA